MGNKKKKKSHKKWKNTDSFSAEKKIRTRRELILSRFPEPTLFIWFGDDINKRNEFADYLIRQEDLYSEDSLDLLGSSNKYEDKLNKVNKHVCRNIDDCIETLHETARLERKAKKYKPKSAKNMNIATYLGKSKYHKKYLSNSEYRKELKSIAKRERDDVKLLKSIGYVSRDPDDELKRLKKANSLMETALSDAYIQKHFID